MAALATTWLEEQLFRLQMPYETDTFTTPLGDTQVTLRNVSVVRPGASKETILVTAPRDTSTIVKVDPRAYTSGTAMLIELVQTFARPHQKTLVFLSTEDGSNGGLGISRFLDTYEAADDVTTILSFQGLGKERAQSLKAGVTASRNTTPGWFVQLAGRVLARAGFDLRVPGILSQAADHALSLSRGDQVAGLSRGISALMLYDDASGNPTATGLSTQGVAIERLILSLDTGTEAPPDPGTALLLKSGRYLTERAVTFVAALMLLPTLAALLIWLFASRVTVRATLMHMRNLVSFVLPGAVIFILALLLSYLGLVPRYRFQVPTIPGPSTEARLAPTLILILIGAATFFFSRRFLGYFRPREKRAATEMTRLCIGFFSLLIGLALMLSRSPFLLLPCLAAAWAWPLATCFAEPVYSGALWRHRFTSNAPVLLLGLLAPIVLYSYVAAADVGWLDAWWFLLVQTVSGAYGVRGPAAAVFITAAFLVLLGVKRMRVVPIETLQVTDELSMLESPVPRSRRKPRAASRPPLSPWG